MDRVPDIVYRLVEMNRGEACSSESALISELSREAGFYFKLLTPPSSWNSDRLAG